MTGLKQEKTFFKAIKKLPPDRQTAALSALKFFVLNKQTNSLDFRRLKAWPNYFIIDSTGGDRVILRYDGADDYAAVDVGTHDIYKKWNRRR
jgi:hypothetical protein